MSGERSNVEARFMRGLCFKSGRKLCDWFVVLSEQHLMASLNLLDKLSKLPSSHFSSHCHGVMIHCFSRRVEHR